MKIMLIKNFILMFSAGESYGERFFIGALTGLTLTIIIYWLSRRNERKEEHLREERIRKATEHSYYNTLKDIVKTSGQNLLFDFEFTKKYLEDKCNPKYYIESRKTDRLEIATDLYTQVKNLPNDTSIESIHNILNIRKKAMELLNINVPNNVLNIMLLGIFNPEKFVEENFDKDKLLACTKAFGFIKRNENKSLILEKFAYDIGLLKYNSTEENLQNQKLKIIVKGKLKDKVGEVVKVCGIYPMSFEGISGDFYHFRSNFKIDLSREEAFKNSRIDYDYFSGLLRIPIDECLEISI